jgi:hypothetical protein
LLPELFGDATWVQVACAPAWDAVTSTSPATNPANSDRLELDPDMTSCSSCSATTVNYGVLNDPWKVCEPPDRQDLTRPSSGR